MRRPILNQLRGIGNGILAVYFPGPLTELIVRVLVPRRPLLLFRLEGVCFQQIALKSVQPPGRGCTLN
jgi:hypothetical protein